MSSNSTPSPPSGPGGANGIVNLISINNNITDTGIKSAAIVDAILGGLMLVAFILVQSKSVLYKIRLVSPYVSWRPPALPRGVSSLWAWLLATLLVSDQELLQTAGLDALMMVKMLTFGIQLFTPIAILGLVVLIPIHTSSDFLATDGSGGNQAQFMRLTLTNVSPGDRVLWLHFVFALLYVTWGCWLLKWHYHQFTTIRQHWLRSGDDINMWRELYADARSSGRNRSSLPKLADVITAVRNVGNKVGNQFQKWGHEALQIIHHTEGQAPDAQTTHQSAAEEGGREGPSRNGAKHEHTHHHQHADLRHARHVAQSAAMAVELMQETTARDSAMDSPEVTGTAPTGVTADGLIQGPGIIPVDPNHVTNPTPSTELPVSGVVKASATLRRRQGRARRASNSAEGGGLRARRGSRVGGEASGDPEPSSYGHQVGPEEVEQLKAQLEQELGPRLEEDKLPMFNRPVINRPPLIQQHPISTGAGPSPQAGASVQGSNQQPQPNPQQGLDVQATIIPMPPPPSPSHREELPIPAASNPLYGTALTPSHSITPLPANAADGVPAPDQLQESASEPLPGNRASEPKPTGSSIPGDGPHQPPGQHAAPSRVATLPEAPSLAASAASGGRRQGSVGSRRSQGGQPVIEELPAWWMAVKTRYDPAAVREEHMGKMSRHRRGHSAGSGFDFGGWSLNGRMLSSAQAPSPRMLSLTSQPSLQGKVPSTRVTSPDRVRLPAVQLSNSIAVDKNLSHRLPVVGGGLRLPRTPSGLVAERGALPAVGRRNTLGTVPATPPETSAAPSLTAPAAGAGAGTSGMNGRHHGTEEGGEPGTARSQPLSVVASPLSTSARHQQQLSALTSGKGPLSWGREPQLDLMRPSVRHRKTINTTDKRGLPVSVHAQQYAVLVTDVNQNLWTGKPLWKRTMVQEGHGALSWFIPQPLRYWVMSNYAVHALGLYDSDSDDEEDVEEELEVEEEEALSKANGCEVSSTKEATTASPGGKTVQGSMKRVASSSNSASSGAATTVELVQFSPEHPPQVATQAATAQQQQQLSNKAMKPDTHPEGQLCIVQLSSGPTAATTVQQDVAGVVGPAQVTVTVETESPRDVVIVSSPRSAQHLWGLVRTAVMEGRVKALIRSKRYSLVTSIFSKLFEEDFERAIPVFKHKQVDLALYALDMHYAQYSAALARYAQTGKRPKRRLGFCGLWGQQVDVIDWTADKIVELQEKVRKERKEAIDSGWAPSWIVFFKTQKAAALCAQAVIHAEDNREFTVSAAPGPEEVNWPALWMHWRQRDWRGWLVKPLLLLLICIPVGIFTGGLQQLDFLFCPTRYCTDPVTGKLYISEGPGTVCADGTVPTSKQNSVTWDWYCNSDSFIARYLSKLVTAWLPGILLTLWQGMVLPLCMLLLSQLGGRCFSLTQIDQLVAHYTFLWNAGQSFIGGVLGSAIVQQINQLFEGGPAQAIEILGNYLPSSSNFFLAYIMLRAMVLMPMRLFLPHIGIRMFIFRRFLFRCSTAPLTDRERAVLYAPTSPRIGVEYGQTLLIFLVGMAYSITSPLVTVVALGYFIVSWITWRYCLLYIFIRKYESGGLMWPVLFDRILVAYTMFGLFTACVFVVKRAFAQAVLLIVLVPIILYRFNDFIFFRFKRAMRHVPLRLAQDAPPATVDPKSYIPPPMAQHSVGWTPEWCKPWQGWDLPHCYSVT